MTFVFHVFNMNLIFGREFSWTKFKVWADNIWGLEDNIVRGLCFKICHHNKCMSIDVLSRQIPGPGGAWRTFSSAIL